MAAFSRNEIATILHSLRLFQTEGDGNVCGFDLPGTLCSHFDKGDEQIEPLSEEQIDALCARLAQENGFVE